MNWRDLSLAYCLIICRHKKVIRGTKNALHKAALPIYTYIETYLGRYGKYPPTDLIRQKFNLELKIKGWTLKSLSDEVKLEKLKFRIEETQQELQERLLGEHSADEYLEPLSKLFNDIMKLSVEKKPISLRDYKKTLKRFLNRDIKEYLKYGYPLLDYRTGGINPGDYIILFAETNQGKSTFSRSIAFNIAKAGGIVLYITLEESDEKSLIKAMSTGLQFDSKMIFDKNLDLNTKRLIQKEMQNIPGDIIFIDKLESRSVFELHNLVQVYKPDIIFLDQLSHFIPSMDWKDVGTVSKQLQAYAQNNKIPMVLLHQAAMYSKQIKGAWGRGPEQDADTAIYLHNDEKDELGNKIKKITITKSRDRENKVSIHYTWKLGEGIIRELDEVMTLPE